MSFMTYVLVAGITAFAAIVTGVAESRSEKRRASNAYRYFLERFVTTDLGANEQAIQALDRLRRAEERQDAI